jgi:hypothetical protein
MKIIVFLSRQTPLIRHGRFLLITALMTMAFTAQAAGAPTNSSAGHTAAPIPFDQIGAMASKQYSGDGLAVVSSPGGAWLRCVFQRLNAQATTEGLWLNSTVDGAKGEPFRVVARTVGREGAAALPLAGKVAVAGQMAQFIRPGLTEEYTVSMDG